MVQYAVGFFLCLFNYWAKVDAHRCIGEYCWYWGDFFFKKDQSLKFDGIFELFPHPMCARLLCLVSSLLVVVVGSLLLVTDHRACAQVHRGLLHVLRLLAAAALLLGLLCQAGLIPRLLIHARDPLTALTIACAHCSLLAHLLQIGFLVLVENPHIEKTYGSGPAMDPDRMRLLYDPKIGLFPRKTKAEFISAPDLSNSGDVATILLGARNRTSDVLMC